LQAVQQKLSCVAEEVQRDAENATDDSPLMISLNRLKQNHDTTTRELAAKLHAGREELTHCEKEAAELARRMVEREPAYQAKKQGRFWTFAYWANRFNHAILDEVESLQKQAATVAENKQRLCTHIEQFTEQMNQLQRQFERERANCLEGEIQSRHEAVLLHQQTLEEEQTRVHAAWADLCRRLEADPAQLGPEAIALAHGAWQKRKKNDEQECQFARQWIQFVEEAGPSLAARLPGFANVLATTIQRWHTDAQVRDVAAGPFDMLIVEDAETLTEADLLKLSRQAARSVLVGQAPAEPVMRPTTEEKAARALLPPPLVSAACWNKLWQTLGGDAGRWPCTWQREQDKWVCRLMALSAEDRQHLESEGLADAPDIELRILHRPRTTPCLAEVIFAPSCSFANAFRFMVSEVQEFPLEPVGRTGWWSEDAQRHYRRLGPNAARIHAWLEIEPGVRLGITEATRASCLEFDKGAGWDCARASAWLYRYRPVHDHERTVFLQTAYRFAGPLAEVVQAVVHAGDWLTQEVCRESAVPPLTKRDWPREGAGLELDLTASRHADRLPVGLRQSLPAHGFVNYLEAQALIRRLEAWQRNEPAASCRIAVLALYEGQVELLRRLVEQSEILRARSFPLEVALPSRLHQRECDVVFLSLTRSHAHRSVAFGEDVKELPLALTRPRSGLIVFGDPGSMCKRTTWDGPLDHLDASSAQQELLRLTSLVAYLQKHGHGVPSANGIPNGKV
jgi:hypothetical protein